MTELNRVTNGISKYLDTDITPKLSGWQKWAFSAAATAYLAHAPAIVSKARGIKALEPLQLFDDNNSIDIEKIYKYIRPAAEKDSAVIDIPIIGRLTLNVNDVDRIYSCIMQS
jgi:hypothetical protein